MKTWFKKYSIVSGLLVASLLFGLSAPLVMAANDRANISDKVREFANSHGQDEVDVIVRYKTMPDTADMARINALGGTVTKSFNTIPMRVIRIPADSIEALSESKGVVSISLDSSVKRFSQSVHMTAKLPSYGMPEYFLVDPNVGIAVLDSGVADHSDLNVQMRMDFTGSSLSSSRSFLDEFNTVTFSNDDGTTNWSGDWHEIGESNSSSRGKARVSSSPYCASGYCLRLRANLVYRRFVGDKGVVRQVDLADATHATLSYDYLWSDNVQDIDPLFDTQSQSLLLNDD